MAHEATLLTCIIMDNDKRYKGEIETISNYLLPHNKINRDDHNLLHEIDRITSYEEKPESGIKFLLATDNWQYILKSDIENCEKRIKYSVWRSRWKEYLLEEGNKFSNGRIAKIKTVYIHTSFELDDLTESMVKSLFEH